MTTILAPAEPCRFPSLASRRNEAIAWLYGRINYECTPPARRGRGALKLQRMQELCERLGRPALSIPTVHVAGTKGKGSTAAVIASILRAAGYRTGRFTSPHLEQIEERFWVDGSFATPEDFVDLVCEVRPVVEEMDAACDRRRGKVGPTFFEVCTALALLHFKRQQAQAVVLEVGLGGRLDATNVCEPSVCAITNISYDHTRQLGSTLAEIAREKAGIIKPGVPVVSGVTPTPPRAVIEKVAAERDARLVQLGRDFAYAYHPSEQSRDGTFEDTFDFLALRPRSQARIGNLPAGSTSPAAGEGLPLPLLGEHQAANAAVALAAVAELVTSGWSISLDAIRQGLCQVKVPARAEVVRRHPTVILDTGHNVASIQSLVDILRARFSGQRRHLVFAATQDKDVAGMLQALLPLFDTVRLTRYTTNPRGLPIDELSQLVDRCLSELHPAHAPEVYRAADPPAAWRSALAAADPGELICITGSFYLAAELRAIVARLPAEPTDAAR